MNKGKRPPRSQKSTGPGKQAGSARAAGSGKTKPPAKARSGPPTAFARLKEQLKTVDLVIEVRDARIPKSSGHPKADELFGHKPRIVVFAKQDLSDPEGLKAWLTKVGNENEQKGLALSLKFNKGQDKVIALALELTASKMAALQARGLLPRAMRACVVGLPNVGKSTMINWLIGKHKAKTGDRPGITRGTQWVRVHPQLELLDTPGILPPIAFDRETSLKLSLCNILPSENYDAEDVAAIGLSLVAQNHPDKLKPYGPPLAESEATLENLAIARSCLAQGGKPDRRRAAAIFLNDFRTGKLGRIILDSL